MSLLSSHRGLSVLPLLALFVPACAASGDASTDDDGEDTSEEALSSCALGAGCATVRLLNARSFLSGPPPNVTRSDLRASVEGGSADAVPRRVSSKTSRPMRFDGGTVTLSGNAEGSAPVVIDDFLLVELLALDGKRISTALVSHAGLAIRLEGRPLEPTTPVVPWSGVAQGYRYAPGSIDLTPLVPRGQAFRIRAGVYDIAGVSIASDVYLRHGSAPSTPPVIPPENDPWSPRYCTDAPMTDAQALARFAPAQSWANVTFGAGGPKIATRTRACHPQTGCASWTESPRFPMKVNHLGTEWGASLPTAVSTSALDVHANGAALEAWVFLNSSEGSTLRMKKNFLGGSASSVFMVEYREPTLTFDKVVKSPHFVGVIGEHCMRATGAVRDIWREDEVVVYGRY